ncbi:hypothetical protein D0Z66_06270 [Cereibacter sphaeroides]|uniref:Transposase n=1 Tax=Cereibacter azotoformans TaxID=43057 RepID=A0A2T5JTP4_9RHOB|nr:hypothetical protein D0Z66_06270 [Cereibacter sphaeroides]MBO4168794.1 hypothetical protein [Cereibacter azotoformans]PTR13561.1 hypothetical protein C8J28_12152 [Cereibacter azotoformans]
MSETVTVGFDLPKTVFHAHGSTASGRTALRKTLRRDQALAFFGQQLTRQVRHGRALPLRQPRSTANHVADVMAEHDFARRLKTLRDLTAYE